MTTTETTATPTRTTGQRPRAATAAGVLALVLAVPPAAYVLSRPALTPLFAGLLVVVALLLTGGVQVLRIGGRRVLAAGYAVGLVLPLFLAGVAFSLGAPGAALLIGVLTALPPVAGLVLTLRPSVRAWTRQAPRGSGRIGP